MLFNPSLRYSYHCFCHQRGGKGVNVTTRYLCHANFVPCMDHRLHLKDLSGSTAVVCRLRRWRLTVVDIVHWRQVDISIDPLTLLLKKLEEDGVIAKKVFNVKPPLRVEYSLTDLGRTLIPLLRSMSDWGSYVAENYAEK